MQKRSMHVLLILKKHVITFPRDKLRAMLLLYGNNGQLLTAIKSLYMLSKACVRVNSALTIPFRVSVGLQQGCSFSPILFLVYVDEIAEQRVLWRSKDWRLHWTTSRPDKRMSS